MAIMARLLGMPARVVAGYTNGQFDPRHNQWVIRGTDAHAWTQIYFATYGWVNFEPSAGFSGFERPLPGSANFAPPINLGGQGSTTGKNNPGHGRVPNSPDDLTPVTTTQAVAQVQLRERISFTLGILILLVLLGLLLFSIWWRRPQHIGTSVWAYLPACQLGRHHSPAFANTLRIYQHIGRSSS